MIENMEEAAKKNFEQMKKHINTVELLYKDLKEKYPGTYLDPDIHETRKSLLRYLHRGHFINESVLKTGPKRSKKEYVQNALEKGFDLYAGYVLLDKIWTFHVWLVHKASGLIEDDNVKYEAYYGVRLDPMKTGVYDMNANEVDEVIERYLK
jgi:hypothetical protein